MKEKTAVQQTYMFQTLIAMVKVQMDAMVMMLELARHQQECVLARIITKEIHVKVISFSNC